MNDFHKDDKHTVEIGDVISHYLINLYNIDISKTAEVEWIDPKVLLSPSRIDLICKLYYIDCIEKQRNVSFATELYREHIIAFSDGTMIEPGQEESKNSFESYINEFNKLIKTITCHGFNTSISVVPLGKTGIPIDGAHRIAIAIYYNLPLPIVRMEEPIEYKYNCEYFEKKGMKRKYLDFMAMEYMRYVSNIFAGCLWPSVSMNPEVKQVEALIEETAEIVYKKRVRFNYRGLKNFMTQIYGGEEWAGNAENNYLGLDGKTEPCYTSKSDTIIYIISGAELSKMVSLKKKIRDIFMIGNHSIHISDTKNEALRIGEVTLNDNSVQLLNYGNPYKYYENIERIRSFYSVLSKYGVNKNEYLVDSGTVISLFGLRGTTDLDYYTLKFDDDILPKSPMYESHLKYEYYYSIPLDQLIYNPLNYMYFEGLKFVSLSNVKNMKSNRREIKDRKDVNVIKRFEIKMNIDRITSGITNNLLHELKRIVKKINEYSNIFHNKNLK